MSFWRCVLASGLTAVFLAAPAPACFAAEPSANVQAVPTQILKTGIDLTSAEISPNTRQLAEILKLTPLLERIATLRGRADPVSFEPNMENLAASQQLMAATMEANQVILEANLAIDFVLAEIAAEEQVYNEMLRTYTNDRDKLVARVNAASFISNGILWALAEAFDIPSLNTTFARNPRKVVQWSIPSGTTGILAGLVPSVASMYTLKAVNGKKRTCEKEPNMLSKLFDYPTNPEIEYPRPVWEFLNMVPAGDSSGKTRKDQLIDRWVADSNIPNFTDRRSKYELDCLTASVARKKGLSIATLSTRLVMLQQLTAEILKMKRMMLELLMVVHGEKHV